jgi:hypothetical protein
MRSELGGNHVKKRSFLVPLAAAVTALTTAGAVANAKPVVTSTISSASEASTQSQPTPAEPLVIQRGKMAQYGHSSHGSHASHASHASHYSSR